MMELGAIVRGMCEWAFVSLMFHVVNTIVKLPWIFWMAQAWKRHALWVSHSITVTYTWQNISQYQN